MMRYGYLFLVTFVYPVAARAQAPLQAAPLPDLDSGKGWLDFGVKLFPVVWGIISPAITHAIATKAPIFFARIPAPVLSIMSVVIGALGGALTGAVDNTLLDAGGVSSSVGAVDGALTAYGVHKVATNVTPGETK